MTNIPLNLELFFAFTTLLAVFLFCRATRRPVITWIILVSWIVLQGFVSASGFYTVTDTIPPRFILLVLPTLVTIVLLFCVPAGRRFLDGLDAGRLTLLHTVRVPVELALFWLFTCGTVPQLMTFEGRNFDILSGITSPLIYYFGYVRKSMGRKLLLTWNFICLGLLFNIVINAVFSAPFPFQQFAFDQPNIAVFHFPFSWLPSCIVPLVLLSHLVCIRRLVQEKSK